MSDEEKDPNAERGFVVIDRRGQESEEETPAPSPTGLETATQDAAATRDALPPIDFAGFVHSIAITTLYHLGLVESEGGEAPAPNFELARQNIDILEMLQEKTRGNLEPEEARLLETLLYDLHMRFVETKRTASG